MNVFDQPVKNNFRTYDNIQKITIGQRDDYATGCLLDYNYFNEYYKMIAIDLSKQPALDADPKAIQEINFTGNLERGWNTDGEIINVSTIMFFIIEEVKETILDFSQGNIKVFWFYFLLKYKMTQYETLHKKLSNYHLRN